MHVPAWQVSVCVHASESLQTVPSLTLVWAQPTAGSHESAVHALLSSQSTLVER